MPFFLKRQVFNRDQLFAMNHGKKNEAGINGAVNQLVIDICFCKHDSTCAAVTFSATLFDPFVPGQRSKIIKHRSGWPQSVGSGKINFNDLIIKNETDSIFHLQFLTSISLARMLMAISWGVSALN